MTKRAYEISEKFDTAVLIKMCTRVAHSQSLVETGERISTETKKYEKNIAKYVMMPAMAKRKHPVVEKRLELLREFAEESDINRVESGSDDEIGFITSSTCYQYVKEVFGDKYPVLKLGMINPLPENKIKAFSKSVKKTVVVEELDSVIEDFCNSIGVKAEGKNIFGNIGEFSQNIIAGKMGIALSKTKQTDENIPNRPPVMCAGCPHRGLFYTLKKNKLNVMGDIGCYTLGAATPLEAMDTTVCMGASVSSLHGFNKAGGDSKKSVAVIGDSTFIHSGITGLIDISYNDSPSTVIILDNSITGMTGHQQNPTTGFNLKGDPAAKVDLETLCRAVGIKNVRVVDPYNLDECDKVINEELQKDEASVVISRRPCALLKYVKHRGPITPDTEKCTGCRSCMKIGCPAISVKNKKVTIDNTLCTGCGVCTQLCRFNVLDVKKEG